MTGFVCVKEVFSEMEMEILKPPCTIFMYFKVSWERKKESFLALVDGHPAAPLSIHTDLNQSLLLSFPPTEKVLVLVSAEFVTNN